jgi:multidrug resistance efflux pump
MRFLARSLTGLFLLAVTAGLLTLAGSLIAGAIADRMAGKEPSRPAQERVFSANVLTITPERIVPELVAFGEIRSRRTLELRSARAGRIIELTEGFADGATVTAGQLLLRLDPADALSARDLALAAEADTRDAARSLTIARDDLAAAEAQLDLRRQALIRQEGLQSRGVGSAAAVETAALAVSAAEQAMLSRRSAVAQAEARVDQVASSLNRANIALAEAERALADTEIRASFDGRLNGVTLVEGRLVSANERLAEIIDPDALEVAFRLSTAQFARLADGKGGVLAADVRVTLGPRGGWFMPR